MLNPAKLLVSCGSTWAHNRQQLNQSSFCPSKQLDYCWFRFQPDFEWKVCFINGRQAVDHTYKKNSV